MLKLFVYDNAKQEAVLNEPDILLIKEFNALFDKQRNKSKTDKTGSNHELAFKELKYIYLAIDWRSPYKEYTYQERHTAALEDSGLTEDQFNNETFRAACRKYKQLQETSIVGSLLQSQYNVIYKMKVYYDNIDLEEKKEDGTRINKTKDILAEMASTAKALDGLRELEQMWQKEQELESSIRGDLEPGFMDY
jgi:hypothetical protein